MVQRQSQVPFSRSDTALDGNSRCVIKYQKVERITHPSGSFLHTHAPAFVISS